MEGAALPDFHVRVTPDCQRRSPLVLQEVRVDDWTRAPTERRRGPVRARLLGALQVETPQASLSAAAFPGHKPRRLLELLLCERGHVVTRAQLADVLWGDRPPQDRDGALQTYVAVLRRTLSPGATPRSSVIVTEPAGYRIGPRGLEVDLDLFDALVWSAATTDPASALRILLDALSLVRGQVLEHAPDEPWLRAVRSTYRDRHVRALVDAGRLSLVGGGADLALDLAERAVSANPLGEAGYQLLMASAYALRRQDAALMAFEECRRQLADALGTDPLEQTRTLHLAVLRRATEADLLAILLEGGQRPRVLATGPRT